jgi:glycosyltransferase involved in cell wall biosynthesis
MAQIAVSIIIPTYNHRDFIIETLESVFAQTFTDYEVIVVNDGSPDDTASVLKPLVEAGRIYYIEQPNAGAAAARNRGLAAARGEYVAFLDDDDLWPANKLQWQVAVLRADASIGLVGGTAIRLGLPAPAENEDTRYLAFQDLFDGNPFGSPGQWLARTPLIHEVGGFDPRIWGADDFEILFRICRRSKICVMRRLALRRSIHTTNASRNIERMLVNCRRVLDRYLRELDRAEQGHPRRMAQRFLYWYWGRRLMVRLRGEVARLNLNAAMTTTRHLAGFGEAIVRDPVLRYMIIRDSLPQPLVSWIQSLRNPPRRTADPGGSIAAL